MKIPKHYGNRFLGKTVYIVQMIRKCLIAALLAAIFGIVTYGQFADCSTGLLQMPTAEMQDDGTFMLTTNFLNKHSLPSGGWTYNTVQYGIYISFWERLEIGYVCTIFNDYWAGSQHRPGVDRINQDRHFTGRVMLLRENEFNLKWMPALVVGASDPTTANGYADYVSSLEGGGFFNRNFIVLTKHFQTRWGQIGAHAGYQFSHRQDYRINGPCAGLDWMPVWFQHKGVLDNLKFILEYDTRTVNLGFLTSIWKNHFEAMFELQNFKWVNFGLRYKLRLRK